MSNLWHPHELTTHECPSWTTDDIHNTCWAQPYQHLHIPVHGPKPGVQMSSKARRWASKVGSVSCAWHICTRVPQAAVTAMSFLFKPSRKHKHQAHCVIKPSRRHTHQTHHDQAHYVIKPSRRHTHQTHHDQAHCVIKPSRRHTHQTHHDQAVTQVNQDVQPTLEMDVVRLQASLQQPKPHGALPE